jgi:hypothetical protein
MSTEMDTSNDGGTTTTFTPSPNSPPTTTTYPNAPQTQGRDPPVSYVRSHSDRYRRRRRRQWMRVTMAATTTTAAPPPLSPDRPSLTPTPTPYPNAPPNTETISPASYVRPHCLCIAVEYLSPTISARIRQWVGHSTNTSRQRQQDGHGANHASSEKPTTRSEEQCGCSECHNDHRKPTPNHVGCGEPNASVRRDRGGRRVELSGESNPTTVIRAQRQ